MEGPGNRREVGTTGRRKARATGADGETTGTTEEPGNRRRRRESDTGGAESQAERTQEPGVATGLAWTPNGGEIMFIESTRMSGQKGLNLTGSLGDVMKESAQAALSYVRTHAAALGIAPDFYDKSDIHVHVPAGAIPKDGPSGGVTIAASLASLLSGRPVRSDIAMTGEITLRGKVLPVGGIKEKVLAARRAGIKTIILPRRNERDLEDIQPEVRKELEMIFVDTVDEVIRHALRDGDAPVQPGAEAVAPTPATARTERTVLN